jgi:beta-aspartyl-peptidase (threonine type)
MEDGDHVLMAGEGAVRFGRERGIELVDPLWHVTHEQRARYEELRASPPTRGKLGTVGAVAVDLRGRVAAATSTGGTAFKRPGRIGDSPLIGAGTYAESRSGAVSCTGHGESIIKLALAKAACDRMPASSPLEAARWASDALRDRVGGAGGLIVIDPAGRAGWAMNTEKMSRALFRAGMASPLAMV